MQNFAAVLYEDLCGSFNTTAFVCLLTIVFFFSQPILRDAFEKNPSMSLDQARQVITRCLQVLFYRDARSLNKVCESKPLLVSI